MSQSISTEIYSQLKLAFDFFNFKLFEGMICPRFNGQLSG